MVRDGSSSSTPTYVEIRSLGRLGCQHAGMIPNLTPHHGLARQDPLVPAIQLVHAVDRPHLLSDIVPSTFDKLALLLVRRASEDLLSPISFSLSVIGRDLRCAEVRGFFEPVQRSLFLGRFGSFVRVGCRDSRFGGQRRIWNEVTRSDLPATEATPARATMDDWNRFNMVGMSWAS